MLCFRIFLVAKKFIKKKGEGDYLNFPSKIFCLTVPEHFVEEPFCAVFQIISGCEKFMEKKLEGDYLNFPSKNFCLTVPKHS